MGQYTQIGGYGESVNRHIAWYLQIAVKCKD